MYLDKMKLLSYLFFLFIVVDQTKVMQEQMLGVGMMISFDLMKVFKGEWEALEVCNY